MFIIVKLELLIRNRTYHSKKQHTPQRILSRGYYFEETEGERREVKERCNFYGSNKCNMILSIYELNNLTNISFYRQRRKKETY
jgi:hypothetical protein